MKATLLCLVAYWFSFAWGAAGALGYDKLDFQCPWTVAGYYCYYKGHPVLQNREGTSTHVYQRHFHGERYFFESEGVEQGLPNVDEILRDMHADYVALTTAHHYYDLKNPQKYANGKFDVYDEYGRDLKKKSVYLLDSFNKPVDWRRMKDILDKFRRKLTYNEMLLTSYVNYLDQKVMNDDGHQLYLSGNDFMANGKKVARNEVIRLLDAIEQVHPNADKAFKEEIEKITDARFDPNRPAELKSGRWSYKPIYDKFGEPVRWTGTQWLDSHKNELKGENIAELIRLDRHPVQEQPEVLDLHGKAEAYVTYRDYWVDINGRHIVKEQHTINGHVYYYKDKDGNPVSDDEFANTLNLLDHEGIIRLYDEDDFSCPHGLYCYYKGQPVLQNPDDILTHIHRSVTIRDQFFVKNTGHELSRADVDTIVNRMQLDYVELTNAHHYYDWENPHVYARNDMPVYDEYGRALISRASKFIPGGDYSVLDSFGEPVNWKRMKTILATFRRQISVSFFNGYVSYLGQEVKEGGHQLYIENESFVDRVPVFNINRKTIFKAKAIQLLDGIENANPGLNKHKGFKQEIEKIQEHAPEGSYFDPTRPTEIVDDEGHYHPIYDRYGEKISMQGLGWVDSRNNVLDGDDIAGLIALDRQPVTARSNLLGLGIFGRAYLKYRGHYVKDGDLFVFRDEHAINGVNYHYKFSDDSSVHDAHFVTLLGRIDAAANVGYQGDNENIEGQVEPGPMVVDEAAGRRKDADQDDGSGLPPEDVAGNENEIWGPGDLFGFHDDEFEASKPADDVAPAEGKSRAPNFDANEANFWGFDNVERRRRLEQARARNSVAQHPAAATDAASTSSSSSSAAAGAGKKAEIAEPSLSDAERKEMTRRYESEKASAAAGQTAAAAVKSVGGAPSPISERQEAQGDRDPDRLLRKYRAEVAGWKPLDAERDAALRRQAAAAKADEVLAPAAEGKPMGEPEPAIASPASGASGVQPSQDSVSAPAPRPRDVSEEPEAQQIITISGPQAQYSMISGGSVAQVGVLYGEEPVTEGVSEKVPLKATITAGPTAQKDEFSGPEVPAQVGILSRGPAQQASPPVNAASPSDEAALDGDIDLGFFKLNPEVPAMESIAATEPVGPGAGGAPPALETTSTGGDTAGPYELVVVEPKATSSDDEWAGTAVVPFRRASGSRTATRTATGSVAGGDVDTVIEFTEESSEDEATPAAVVVPAAASEPVAVKDDGSGASAFATVSFGFLALSLLVAF